MGALPAIYANAHFSQEHETEADIFALEYMKRFGLNPEAFARALEHLSQKEKGAEEASEVLKYLSSHPPTPERIARFRK
jgi:predicted Zn-dependent protease